MASYEGGGEPETAGTQARGFAVSIVRPNDPERAAKVGPWVDRLSWTMDNAFRVPLTQRRVGIDGIIGVIPGIGDAAGLVVSCTVVVAAVLGGVSGPTLARMIRNVLVDAGVGAVPIVGDAFDFVRKTNQRNVALIHADLADRASTARASSRVLLWTALVVIAVLTLVCLAAVALGWWLYRIVAG